MSQEIVSQRIKRTCQGCDAVKEYELVGMSEDTTKEMQDWYTVIREVFDGERFVKIMAQACSLACVPAAAVKLALPPQPEEPEIDLASLRSGGSSIN